MGTGRCHESLLSERHHVAVSASHRPTDELSVFRAVRSGPARKRPADEHSVIGDLRNLSLKSVQTPQQKVSGEVHQLARKRVVRLKSFFFADLYGIWLIRCIFDAAADYDERIRMANFEFLNTAPAGYTYTFLTFENFPLA